MRAQGNNTFYYTLDILTELPHVEYSPIPHWERARAHQLAAVPRAYRAAGGGERACNFLMANYRAKCWR